MKINQELLIKYMNQATYDGIYCKRYCMHLEKSDNAKYRCNLFLVFSELKYEYDKESRTRKIIRCKECLESYEGEYIVNTNEKVD